MSDSKYQNGEVEEAVMEKAIVFSNEGQKMYGILHEPDSIPNPFIEKIGVIIFHAGRQSRRGPHHLYVKVARALCESGFFVLRYDNRGYGDSEGKKQQTPEDWASDAMCAMNFFLTACELRNMILWGLCGGAVLAVHCAARQPGIVDSLILCNLIYKMELGKRKEEFKTVYRKLLSFNFWRKMLSASPTHYLRKGLPNLKRRFMTAFFPNQVEIDFEESAVSYLRSLPKSFSIASKPTLLIFSGVDPAVSGYEKDFLGDPLWGEHLKGIPIDVFSIGGADHNFSSIEYENKAIEETVLWAVNRTAGLRNSSVSE